MVRLTYMSLPLAAIYKIRPSNTSCFPVMNQIKLLPIAVSINGLRERSQRKQSVSPGRNENLKQYMALNESIYRHATIQLSLTGLLFGDVSELVKCFRRRNLDR